jgi:hypothetical protein
MRDLKYYEQNVNNRFGTSAVPEIDAALLPQSATQLRLKWRRLPAADVELFDDGSELACTLAAELCRDGDVYLPIHPSEESRWPGEVFVESGSIFVSASYRTVFFEPDNGGILSSVDRDGIHLMMKLHLEEPLPGIPGDRRLNKDIVQKCVTFSPYLQQIMREDPLCASCEVLPEFLGLSNGETGVIFRQMPAPPVLPVFSLFSPDPGADGPTTHIEAALRRMYGSDAVAAAKDLGEQLARPLARPLLAGFKHGFSIETHAQNVLFRPGKTALIDAVFLRDLEGVILSNPYRKARGLEPLFEDLDNEALAFDAGPMRRWFNRNVDQDLGTIFRETLQALTDCGYFGQKELSIAVRSIRKVARQCVKEAGVEDLNWPGRLLPISRSPYGNGLSKGHYYRTRYR